MTPQPEPRPALQAVNDSRITDIAIVNPSILLVETGKRLGVLLSRDTIREPDCIHLFGARLIYIPLGWRLRLLRLASRFHRGCLPDEWEYHTLDIKLNSQPARAEIDGRILWAVANPNLLLPLIGSEYKTLIEARGRYLHAWVGQHFGVGTGASAQTPRIRDQRWAA